MRTCLYTDKLWNASISCPTLQIRESNSNIVYSPNDVNYIIVWMTLEIIINSYWSKKTLNKTHLSFELWNYKFSFYMRKKCESINTEMKKNWNLIKSHFLEVDESKMFDVWLMNSGIITTRLHTAVSWTFVAEVAY